MFLVDNLNRRRKVGVYNTGYKMLLKVIQIFLVCMLLPTTHERRTLPRQIISMLNGVKSFDEFVEVFEMRQLMINFTTENQRMRNNDAGVVAQLENELCKPRPVLVKVEQPNDVSSFRYPFYVTLHRCMGSCGANPFLSRCTAAEIKLLHLRAAQVSWLSSENHVSKASKIVLLPLLNETKCGCECKNRLEGCNRFQIWEKNSCRCECTGYCPRNFIYTGGYECCTCAKTLQCARKKIWNPKKCSCECKRTTCKNPAKERDRKTCRCVCKEKVCRYGVLDPKSCRCGRRNYII